MSRMKKDRSALLKHIKERLSAAFQHDSESTERNADMFFDAIAMAAFELDYYSIQYWDPYCKEIDELIEIARRACLEYENEPTDEHEAWSRMFAASDYLESRIAALAESFAGLSVEPLPVPTPIAQLLIGRCSTDESEAGRRAEQEKLAERSIRRQQTLTHILVMQRQIDHALTDIGKELAGLMHLGE